MLKSIARALLLTTFVTANCLSTGSKEIRWAEMRDKKLISFDWNCTATCSFPQRALRKIVNNHIPRDERNSPTRQGDRSFAIRLIEGKNLVHFVPLSCGAVGNCTWGIFTAAPAEFFGELSGEFIYTYKSQNGWPMIVTYTHESVADGILATYVFRNGRYRWIGDEYHVDYWRPPVKPLPRLFTRAKKQCAGYGR